MTRPASITTEAPAPEGRPALVAAGIEPMLSFEDLAAALNLSRRTLDRLKSVGRLPPADFRVGRMLRWRPETIRLWIDQQGKGRGAR